MGARKGCKTYSRDTPAIQRARTWGKKEKVTQPTTQNKTSRLVHQLPDAFHIRLDVLKIMVRAKRIRIIEEAIHPAEIPREAVFRVFPKRRRLANQILRTGKHADHAGLVLGI